MLFDMDNPTRRIPVDQFPARLTQLVEIRKLLPKYFFEDAAEER